MVKLSLVEAQLKQVGCSFRFWGRSEMRELCEILLPGETIAMAVNGQYEAGFAMLVATDFRVLLIDKKPKYLTLKDIRFDMITELDFSSRWLNSTVHVYTPNRELRFTTPSGARLRKLFGHTQHKVMEIRHHFMMQQFQQQQLAKNTPPGVAMAMQQFGPVYGSGGSGGFDGVDSAGEQSAAAEAAHFYQAQALPQLDGSGQSGQSAQGIQGAHGFHDTSEEQRKLAIAMGAAGLRSIVHNGRVIKAHMAVPFTQRWRKRPYGYTNTPLQRSQTTSVS